MEAGEGEGTIRGEVGLDLAEFTIALSDIASAAQRCVSKPLLPLRTVSLAAPRQSPALHRCRVLRLQQRLPLRKQ